MNTLFHFPQIIFIAALLGFFLGIIFMIWADYGDEPIVTDIAKSKIERFKARMK